MFGTVAQLFLLLVSLKRFRLRLRIVYREAVVVGRIKTKDETDIQNRYVAETHNEKP